MRTAVNEHTIMDWQIRESTGNSEDIHEAQGTEPPTHDARYRWQTARGRCATAWNARVMVGQ